MSLDDEPDDVPWNFDDNFPFEKLECQYFDICKFYNEKGRHCAYDSPCDLRRMFRNLIEDYIPEACMNFQIQLILRNGRDNPPGEHEIDIDFD